MGLVSTLGKRVFSILFKMMSVTFSAQRCKSLSKDWSKANQLEELLSILYWRDIALG